MKKKVISSLVCMTMVATMLAGCSKKDEEENKGSRASGIIAGAVKG